MYSQTRFADNVPTRSALVSGNHAIRALTTRLTSAGPKGPANRTTDIGVSRRFHINLKILTAMGNFCFTFGSIESACACGLCPTPAGEKSSKCYIALDKIYD